jgi:maleate isomerase/arylmalonate decarboxylase
VPRDAHYRPYGWRAKLGLIVPPTNTVNEAEWARMAPEGVTVHVARMPLHTDTESEAGRRRLREDIRASVTELAKAAPDVIAYACTAGSMVMPLDALTGFMEQVSGVPAVATAPALVLACRALGLQRIALATPYHDALNEHEVHFLGAAGIEAVSVRGLGIGAGGPAEYVRIARVPKNEVYAHCRDADTPSAQGMLISCTDFAALEAIPRLEAELGKPAVSSNLATLWAALRRAGIEDRIAGFGRLLEAA